MRLAVAHRWAGVALLAAFLVTGVLLRFRGLQLIEANEAVRFSLRANHIYILLAGLLNLAVGLYATAPATAGRRRAQRLGSALLVAGSGLLVAAYFAEGPHAVPQRPLTAAGVLLLLAGVLLHVPARHRAKAAP